MNKFKRCIVSLVLMAVLICNLPSVAHASGISPLWDNTDMVETAISFKNNVAACSVYISGKPGTSRITGSMTLMDTTLNTRAGFWTFNTSNRFYDAEEYCNVVKGHSYKLSVLAYVYNAEGVKESVTGSISDTN